jgi:hypothetical protein
MNADTKNCKVGLGQEDELNVATEREGTDKEKVPRHCERETVSN